jgi:hypothetical protein
MMRPRLFLLATLALTVSMVGTARASAVLVGDTITFQLLDDGVGLGSPLTQTEAIVVAGAGIEAGDGSAIGDGMLDGEYIRVFDTSVEFRLFGGSGVTVPGFPAYQTTGFGANARYVLTDLFDPGVAEITGVSIVLTDAVNVTLGDQVAFDAHSVTLFVDDLGILTSGTNLGLVRLNLTVSDLGPGPGPAPIPEPGTLVLLGSGAAAAWFRRRRSTGVTPVSQS